MLLMLLTLLALLVLLDLFAAFVLLERLDGRSLRAASCIRRRTLLPVPSLEFIIDSK